MQIACDTFLRRNVGRITRQLACRPPQLADSMWRSSDGVSRVCQVFVTVVVATTSPNLTTLNNSVETAGADACSVGTCILGGGCAMLLRRCRRRLQSP